jgi:hypothetical protein
MFHTIDFFARQILGIVGSQIETKMIFSLAGIFTNLKICCLQSKNLEKLIFVSKNWLNDARVGCKYPNDLVKLIEMDEKSEEKLEESEHG